MRQCERNRLTRETQRERQSRREGGRQRQGKSQKSIVERDRKREGENTET